MKRSDEIVKALRTLFEKCECEIDADTKVFFAEAFVAGVGWADKNPSLESIWHDATEEPQGDYEIMCQDEFEYVWITYYRETIENYKNGWEECAACERIVRWAYISDLLPQHSRDATERHV